MSLTASNPGYACPKFEGCNAAYCPALGGAHLANEPVCLYLREAVKQGGEARVRAAVTVELAEVVLRDAQALMSDHGPLARALRKASETGSKIEQWQRAGERLRRSVAA